jgi:hypothetical protein
MTDNTYTPPGIVSVSTKLADYLAHIYHGMERKFIPIISYCHERKHRENKDSPWVDDGPGYSIGLMPVEEMPSADLIAYKDAFYVIDIPEEIWQKSNQRLLDYADRGNEIILT